MRFLKCFSLTCIIFFSLNVAFSQKSIEIKGVIKNNTFKEVSLKKAYENDQAVIASVPIRADGSFTLKVNSIEPDLFMLFFADKNYLLSAFYPGEKIEIEIDGNDVTHILSSKGSKSLLLSQSLMAKISRNQTLLDSINTLLQQDQTQLFFNTFYQDFAPYQKTNKEMDEALISLMDAALQLDAIVSRFSKNGQALPKQVDSLLLLAPELLKTIRDKYTIFDSYLENVKPNYDMKVYYDGRYPEYSEQITQYVRVLDERHDLAMQTLKNYVKEVEQLLQKREQLLYDHLLENRKHKTSLADDIVRVSDQYADDIELLKGTFLVKAQASENLSKELFETAQNKVSGTVAYYQQMYNTESTYLSDAIKKDLLDNKEDLTTIFFIDYLPKESNAGLHGEVVDALYRKYPNNRAVQERYNQMNSPANKTTVGAMAPELTFPNPDGTMLKLSDLRGKYVLIDFWASWCGPCRRENPNVVNLYHQYKDKGFDIFSVSLDREKGAWVKAIETDKLVWKNHVSDLKYWSSEAAKLYGVNSIPATFLIDREGRIVAKNLRGAELENVLKQIFGGEE